MKYPYMTLPDDTEITHSDVQGNGEVLVYIETPTEKGFNHATCILPKYIWKDVEGYSEVEFGKIQRLIQNNAHLIMEFAAEGGFDNAAAV